MNHIHTMRARIAAALVLGLALAACGGGTPTGSLAAPGERVPAGTILSKSEAKKLPKPSPIASPSPTAVTSVVGTALPSAVPSHTQGPPGNPVAQTLADPPVTGVYSYRATATSQGFGDQTVEFDLKVGEAKTVRGGKEQEQVWDIPQFAQRFTYQYQASQLLLTAIDSTGFDGENEKCSFEPPQITLKLPLSKGATWTWEGTCGKTSQRTTSTVTRTERLTIGESEVDTFVIESKTTSERDGQKAKSTTTSWYAPTVRLLVRAETDVPQYGLHTTVEALSVVPRDE